MLSPAKSEVEINTETLTDAAEVLKQNLLDQAGNTLIRDIFLQVDANLISNTSNFVYNNLPLFLTETDYLRIDSLMHTEKLAALMQQNYSNLISPAGFALKNYILQDPLGILLRELPR